MGVYIAPSIDADAAVVAAVALVLVACSLPHTHFAWSKLIFRNSPAVDDPECRWSAWYEDLDGKASPESVADYQATLRRIKLAILLLCLIGVGLAVGVVTNSLDIAAEWLSLACWLVVLSQAATIQASFNLGAFRLASWSILSGTTLVVLAIWQTLTQKSREGGHEAILGGAQAVCAFLLTFACAALPRRPIVYSPRGVFINTEWSSSQLAIVWYRFFFLTIMASALRNGDHLEIDDLGRPDHSVMASTLSGKWEQVVNRASEEEAPKSPLWRRIVWYHRWDILHQVHIAFWLGTTRVAPTWVLHRFLTEFVNIEDLTGFTNYHARSLAWAGLLFLVMMLETCVGHLTYLYGMNRFAIPVRNELASLVLQKIFRAKDIRTAKKESQSAGENEDPQQKQRISEIGTNILSIDVQRITDFACLGVSIFTNSFAFIEACVSLTVILGLLPFLFGALGMLLLLGISAYAFRVYASIQKSLMKARDIKAAVIIEALNGIRQIKFTAYETEWEEKITAVREKEFWWLGRIFKVQAVLMVLSVSTPVVLTIFSFGSYSLMVGRPTPAAVFACFALFQTLVHVLGSAPDSVKSCVDTWISVQRIEQFLGFPEVQDVTDPASAEIIFKGATVAWPSDVDDELEEDRFVLRNINVKFPRGELSLITGKTGTGKSLFLAAILGEADVITGTVRIPRPPVEQSFGHDSADLDWIIPGASAFVSQTPWIENASIVDNIVFGLPVRRRLLDSVMHACALTVDIEALPDGELTEVGVNGVTLSGGQKWRLSLARAIYSRAGILILDDIFSAVDSHVGRHLYEHCLGGEICQGRTVVLVTHHVSLCASRTRYLVELGEGGSIMHAGPVHRGADEEISKLIALEQEMSSFKSATIHQDTKEIGGLSPRSEENRKFKAGAAHPPKPRELVKAEYRAIGAVKRDVWSRYLKALGGAWVGVLGMLILLFDQAVVMASSWWLKIWTSADDAASHPKFYLIGYVCLGLISILVTVARAWFLFSTARRASRSLFRQFNSVILHAPISWFDITPLGRIINRYESDFAGADGAIWSLATVSFHVIHLVVTVISGAIVAPGVLVVVIVIWVPFRPLIRAFNGTLRPCQRLGSTTRATVMQTLLTTIQGVTTLRAFRKQDYVMARAYEALDSWSMTTMAGQLCYRWMGVRTGTLGGLLSAFIAVFVTLWPGVSTSAAGFALSFAVITGGTFYAVCESSIKAELAMTSAERIFEYTDMPSENPLHGEAVPASWPTKGDVEVKNLTVAYDEDLPPVLKDVSFRISGGKKLGVIGRTGAGKSTLTLSLFRFIQKTSGAIFIDGVDISKMRLQDLRGRLAIIPQDPVLFTGTIRTNLDPFDRFSDDELLGALREVHLTNIANDPETSESASTSTLDHPTVLSLSTPVSQGGSNLSQGQGQLLCLARAIVSRPKLLVLDEATSAIDNATDALIQRSIRNQFHDSTLVVVAHRLATIANFDAILVLGDGRVLEFGAPRELWGAAGADRMAWGAFRALCEASGDIDILRETVVGSGATSPELTL